MTVIVAYKYAANPQDASVRMDGTVDWSRAKASVSEYDPVAIQIGRNFADASGEELVGVSVGNSQIATSLAKKNAMSKGFDRGVIIADDDVATWNSTRVASALAQIVKKIEGARIVITGDSSIDDGARMMSALVAGYLNWPCFQEVVSIDKTDDGVRIVQQVAGGTRTIKISGNAVLSVTSDAVEPKVPSMKEILAAGKKKVEEVSTSELMLADAAISVTSRSLPPAVQRSKKIFTGEEAAASMVAALRADGIL